MNFGTKLRTILVIATCFNTALMATDITQFHNPTLDLIYKILSVVANFVIVFCATYFNNDYTPEGSEGTGYTRFQKLQNKGVDIGVDVEGLDYIDDDDFVEDGDGDE